MAATWHESTASPGRWLPTSTRVAKLPTVHIFEQVYPTLLHTPVSTLSSATLASTLLSACLNVPTAGLTHRLGRRHHRVHAPLDRPGPGRPRSGRARRRRDRKESPRAILDLPRLTTHC